MSLPNNIVNENDFKYYMQDVSKNYFGARFNYNELLDNELVPFKFKTIISRYIAKNIDKDTTLESHFYYMDRDDECYRVYKQLKATIRVSQYKNINKPVEERTFKEKLYSIDDFSVMPVSEKEEKGIIVREIIISKLSLFAFMV